MKTIECKMTIPGLVTLVALIAVTAFTQVSPQLDLPKVGEPDRIRIGYTKEGRGRIAVGDKNGTVQQYLEVWENQSNAPNVVTYVLVGGRQPFTATWGRGPVNTAAFSCKADKLPEFGEKDLWVATVTDRGLKFQEIEYSDLKGLFEALTITRRDWGRRMHRSLASSNEQNIMIFLNEKNRRKWLEQSWLQPATNCVRHF